MAEVNFMLFPVPRVEGAVLNEKTAPFGLILSP